jgi:hypothetical protein
MINNKRLLHRRYKYEWQVKYQGPGNDRAFLLSTALTHVELTVLLQQLQ